MVAMTMMEREVVDGAMQSSLGMALRWYNRNLFSELRGYLTLSRNPSMSSNVTLSPTCGNDVARINDRSYGIPWCALSQGPAHQHSRTIRQASSGPTPRFCGGKMKPYSVC